MSSGNLAQSIDGAGMLDSLVRFETARLRVFIGTVPKARLATATVFAEPSHYALKRVTTSTAVRAECEDQSRRFDKTSYSGPNARSLETGNQPTNSARKLERGGNRRADLCLQGRSRELRAE